MLTAYDTFWPAAVRGGKLLATGQVRRFTRKLLNELPDARDAATAPARTGPRLFLAGHVLAHSGYDHLVLAILKGLTASGIDVHRDARACFRKVIVPAAIRPGEARRRRDQPRLAVCPPHLLHRYRPDRSTAVFTMWETDTLPDTAVEQLNHCGLVIVPSVWGADCFRANGVRVPIRIVPLGYDPAIYHLAESRPSGCVLGTAGALDEGGLRKNVQRVIDQFRQAFPNTSRVRLRVKISPTSPAVQTHGDSRIDVLNQPLTAEELADWYRSLTAFVNGSFGEGFGLHLLEAMACGVPLISTTFGGAGSFFDSNVGYAVPHTLVEAKNAIYRGHWGDPDTTAMLNAMKRVHQNRPEAARLGVAAARRAARFSWEDTIRKLVIVLIQEGFIRNHATGGGGVVGDGVGGVVAGGIGSGRWPRGWNFR